MGSKSKRQPSLENHDNELQRQSLGVSRPVRAPPRIYSSLSGSCHNLLDVARQDYSICRSLSSNKNILWFSQAQTYRTLILAVDYCLKLDGGDKYRCLSTTVVYSRTDRGTERAYRGFVFHELKAEIHAPLLQLARGTILTQRTEVQDYMRLATG